VRDFRREDADAVAVLLHEAEPPEAVTGAGIVHWQEKQPERAHVASWVAEEDGEIVGWARAALRWAAENGFETIMTGTDEANAGMNALNESLGYRRLAIETQYLREDLS